MIKEFIADEIVTSSSSRQGELIRYRPGCLRVSKSTGKILSVGPLSKSKTSLTSSKKRFRCIIPGLVDPHTHLVFAGSRSDEWSQRLEGKSYQEIAAEGGGIKRSVRSTRELSVNKLLAIAKKRLNAFARFGVTSVEIKSGYGLNLQTELKLLQCIKDLKRQTSLSIFSSFMGAHALPPEFDSTESYVEHLIKVILPRVKNLADFQDVFVERGYFGVIESIRLLKAGKRLGLIPRVHAHEFGRTGGVQVAASVGAASADHLQYMNDEDVARLKRAKVVPVILPGTSFFLGAKKFSPAKKMWKAGLPVAIASDFNPGTNPSYNLPLFGSFAAIFAGLSLDQVLIAQTWHAAQALRRTDRGRLAKGLRADFVSLDADRFEDMYYYYGCSLVRDVYVAGKKIV